MNKYKQPEDKKPKTQFQAKFISCTPAEISLPVFPEIGDKFNYSELCWLLDCNFVQEIPVHSEFILLVDKEGEAHGKMMNDVATFIASAARSLAANEFIFGDAVLCHRQQLRLYDLSREVRVAL